MNKLTDEQIVKALECCKKGTCKACPFYEAEEDCEFERLEDALNLINRLQAEVKQYKALYESAQDSCWEGIRLIHHFRKAKHAFIERLKENISNKIRDKEVAEIFYEIIDKSM